MRPLEEMAVGEPSSPACAMHEADDAYMGYLAPGELLAALALLAASLRAGDAQDARWCEMLERHIEQRGGAPAGVSGFARRLRGMAPAARKIAKLHGLIWLVRKLERLLPRVRDDRLHADLSAMRRDYAARLQAMR